MIAVDTSALIAVIAGEPEAEDFAALLATNDCLVGAPTQLEAIMVANRSGGDDQRRDLVRIFSWKNVAVVDFSGVHVEIAHHAFHRFGQGRGHRARLNFGDCMAYATASYASAPLLFKGDDFIHTDIRPAWRP